MHNPRQRFAKPLQCGEPGVTQGRVEGGGHYHAQFVE